MKTTEIITLIGVLLTFIVSIITQIYTRKNIKHSKIIENIINSKYTNLKEIKSLTTVVVQSANSKIFISDNTEYNKLMFNLTSLEMELRLFEIKKEHNEIVHNLKTNISNKYNVNYNEMTNKLIDHTTDLIKRNISGKKIKTKNHEWGFN